MSVLNVNVGVLGHVDCGKTSLALDKHPQSKERGITLDLGFSSFTVSLPDELQSRGYSELQFTLVDCPGHASLIRTIIGGVQIIDTMVLVIDITKGLQAQTAECLVVGEIAARNMVVALNKIDQVPDAVRAKAVKRASKLIKETLAATKFAGATIIPVSAKPVPQGVQEVKDWLTNSVVCEQQAPGCTTASSTRPFLFAIDHCFPLKGQGTIMTGTVLQGSCRLNDTIELPAHKLSRQVKSMQMFHRPVNIIHQGDRAALCVTQLNSKLLERGLAAAPGSVPTFTAAVAAVDKVRFYSGAVPGKAKYHMSIGHATVMAEVAFFGMPDSQGCSQAEALHLAIQALNKTALHTPQQAFDFSQQYLHQEELFGLEGRPAAPITAASGVGVGLVAAATADAESALQEERHYGQQWALLKFDQPVTAPEDAVIIGARFDFDTGGDSCRLAFYGRLLTALGQGTPEDLKQLQVYKVKERQGVIERVAADGCSAICKGLFKKETDMAIFEGATVVTGRGEVGVIRGKFGLSGKFKVDFASPGLSSTPPGRTAADNVVILRHKRFVYDVDKHLIRQ
eukprot:gene12357-12491_t